MSVIMHFLSLKTIYYILIYYLAWIMPFEWAATVETMLYCSEFVHLDLSFM